MASHVVMSRNSVGAPEKVFLPTDTPALIHRQAGTSRARARDKRKETTRRKCRTESVRRLARKNGAFAAGRDVGGSETPGSLVRPAKQSAVPSR
ncbi:hypothetical protein MTO96_026265 [Rhipicephalus appendiculatus]